MENCAYLLVMSPMYVPFATPTTFTNYMYFFLNVDMKTYGKEFQLKAFKQKKKKFQNINKM